MKNMMKMLLVFVAMVSVSWGESISLGETAHGSLTENSNLEYSHYSSYNKKFTEHFTFTLTKEQEVFISLKSSFAMLLEINDNQHNYISGGYGDRISGVYSFSCIQRRLKAGTYIIDAISERGEFGDFALSLTNENIIPNHTIILNSTQTGAFSVESGYSLELGYRKEYYTFTLAKKTSVVIVVDSGDIYSALRLYASNGKRLFSSAIGNRIVANLDAGTYTIDVSSSRDAGLGEFTVSLRENYPKITTPLALGDIVEGAWSNKSNVSEGQYRSAVQDFYTFTLDGPTSVLIKLDSDLEEVLSLYDKDEKLIESASSSHDDAVGSRMRINLKEGTYIIRCAEPDDGYKYLGDYTLSLEKANSIATHTINLNTTVDGAWTEESGVSLANVRAKEYYTFTLTEKKRVMITLDSTLDERLRLYDMQGKLIANGSSFSQNFEAESTYSRIVVLLDAGTYKIDVTTRDNPNHPDLGNFSLSLEEPKPIVTHDISLDTTVNDSFTKNSGVADNSREQENYKFTLSKKTRVAIVVESLLSTKLRLYDDKGNYIKSGEFDGRMGVMTKRLIAELDAGTYIITMSTQGDYSVVLGDYALSLEKIKEQTPIHELKDLNTTINGEWTLHSQISSIRNKDTFAEYYTFTLQKNTVVKLMLNPASVPKSYFHISSIMYLKDEQGEVLEAKYICCSPSVTITRELEAGIYMVEIATMDKMTTGTFKLTIEADIKSDYSYLIPIYGLLLN